jgi:hypothetical protein
MSTLTMAMAAALVAGIAPKQASAEPVKAEKAMHFEGILYGNLTKDGPISGRFPRMDGLDRELRVSCNWKSRDKGKGPFTLRAGVKLWRRDGSHAGDDVTFWVHLEDRLYPLLSFRMSEGPLLLILRSVLPRK